MWRTNDTSLDEKGQDANLIAALADLVEHRPKQDFWKYHKMLIRQGRGLKPQASVSSILRHEAEPARLKSVCLSENECHYKGRATPMLSSRRIL